MFNYAFSVCVVAVFALSCVLSSAVGGLQRRTLVGDLKIGVSGVISSGRKEK